MKSNLKEHREYANWKQYELADKLGISKSYMCQIEKGDRTPPLELAYDIASILGSHVEDIWTK